MVVAVARWMPAARSDLTWGRARGVRSAGRGCWGSSSPLAREPPNPPHFPPASAARGLQRG